MAEACDASERQGGDPVRGTGLGREDSQGSLRASSAQSRLEEGEAVGCRRGGAGREQPCKGLDAENMGGDMERGAKRSRRGAWRGRDTRGHYPKILTQRCRRGPGGWAGGWGPQGPEFS